MPSLDSGKSLHGPINKPDQLIHNDRGGKYISVGTMKLKFYTLIFVTTVWASSSSRALEYPSTCRGASAVVTEISGLDSSRARLVAQYTYPDAIAYCHYSLSNGEAPPSASATASCSAKFMKDIRRAGLLSAEANCEVGALSASAGKWSNAYKFPIFPMCGDDNNQAIALFRILCPSYKGQIEKAD